MYIQGAGIISFITASIKEICLTTTQLRQTARMRAQLFRAFLSQPISYFDMNPTGEISSLIIRSVSVANGTKASLFGFYLVILKK